MAHGLETRVPFMDNDLVEFAMQCPVGLKVNNLAKVLRINENELGSKRDKYFARTNDGKQLLRDVMTRHVPKSVTVAEKQGFSAPDASWFKGDSIRFLRNTLINRNAKVYEIFDRDTVVNLIGEHLSGKRNRRLLIWSFLNLESLMHSETFDGMK